jgi:Type II secretion system (T2SS), protein N
LKASWRLPLAGAAAYLLIMLISLPADRVAKLLEQNVVGLDLQSVSGNLFSGKAERLVIHGLGMGPVSWTLRPLSLLLARLEYRLDLKEPVFRGTGVVGTGPGGHVYLHDLRAELKPDPLVNHFLSLPVRTSGDVRLLIESMDFVDGFPRELSGHVDWADARIVEPMAMSLGHVEATLHSEENSLVCLLSGTGETALSGEFSLTRGDDYRLDLLVTPGAEVSADIVDGLKTFAQARPGGAYLITDSGRW